MTDVAVYPLAARLLSCVTAELAHTRAGAPCVATVHPGDMTPMYGWCDCGTGEGMAWVRVASMYPTRSFPAPLVEPVRAKMGVQTAVVVEVGVDRCYWTPDDNAMPDPAVLDSAARDAIDDYAAILRAVWCCFDQDSIIGPWTPRGPAGGIHGGMLTVTAIADGWCGCDGRPPGLDEITPRLPGDPRAQTA